MVIRMVVHVGECDLFVKGGKVLTKLCEVSVREWGGVLVWRGR